MEGSFFLVVAISAFDVPDKDIGICVPIVNPENAGNGALSLGVRAERLGDGGDSCQNCSLRVQACIQSACRKRN